MSRMVNSNATHLYFTKVVNTYALPDGTTNQWTQLYGPYDMVNPARTQFNRAKRDLEEDKKTGRLGPRATPLWDQQINIERTVEMMRTEINLEEESTW